MLRSSVLHSTARPGRLRAFALVPLALFATACATASPTGMAPPGQAARGGPTTEAASPVVNARSVTPDSWAYHGYDLAETRYSPLDQIDASNVAALEVAWSYEVPKRGARIEASPIVVDGMMFTTGPLSTVFALDARTGEEIWRWDPAIPTQREGGPPACCGLVNRGVAIWGETIFAGLLDGRLVALNMHDGSVEWTVQTTPPGDYSITGAPRVFRNMVVIGNGGAEYGVRGYVTAYDVETGEQRWRTYTVPGNPADGFESEAMRRAAETWTGNWWEIGAGGGTVWDAMAYDGAANLLYIGVGNGAPWNRDFRSPGGGDNLYLSSIIALDGDTGEYVWHYQTTPGDDWDYTATQPLMLLDLEIDGRERQVITQAPKNGFFYVIDRITGELISAEIFADDVTWATHIDTETGRPVESAEARYGTNRVPAWISPGPTGAHNWQPMAFSEQTGLVYIPMRNTIFWYEMQSSLDFQGGQWNTGTTLGRAMGERSPRPEMAGPPNALTAWDPVAQEERWRFVPEPRRRGDGGTLATGGNLVFWGTGTEIIAFDASTGEELWAAPVGRSPGTPATYSLDGKQYLTIAGGVTDASGAPTVWTFVLPG